MLAYAQNLREERYADAWRMLSRELQRSLPLEEFERLARERPEEVRETARWLESVDRDAPATATLTLTSGETLRLIEDQGRWYLDPSVVDLYGQQTPRQAIRAFTRALDRRRWEILLRFAPRSVVAQGLTADRLREAWEAPGEAESVQAMLDALRSAADRPIEVTGDRATMTYGAGSRYTMQLVREDGLWKVEDPD